jgi:DNA-binding helix-turn-helix protein
MITDELKLEISDFSDWCAKNQKFKHYQLVLQLFDNTKVTEIYSEFQKVIDEYPLPKDMYLVTTTHNNAYFSLNGKIITEKSLTYYLSKKENPKDEFLRIRNKFKVAIPYLQFRFADIVEKNLNGDIIASIINERIKQGLTIEELAEKAQIEISLLNKIETRKQTPSLRILYKIVKALNKQLKLI